MNLNLEVNVWPDKRRNIYNGTFQTAKSNDVDLYVTTPLQHVGVLSGLSERPNLNGYYKQFGIILFTTANGRRLSDAMAEIRRKLVIVGDSCCGKVCPDKSQCGLRR